jgi:hypothetical protein
MLVREVAWWAVNARALARISGTAVRAHGGGRLRTVIRLRRLRRRAFEFDEALADGLLDPAIGDAALEGYVSRHVAHDVEGRVNPEAFAALTAEKALFYRHCEAIGLPVPRLVAVVDRRTAGWGVGDRVLRDEDDFAAVIDGVDGDLVVKPSDSGTGTGLRVVERRGKLLVDAEGAITPQELWRALREQSEFACFVVQERIRNHPGLAEVAPSRALHTIRLATIVPSSGRPEVGQAVIRLGLGGGLVDNFGDGSSGNAYAEIDAGTGRLGPLHMAAPHGCGFVRTPVVPATGARLEGWRLPFWDEARDLALDAARRFLPVRSIGWDIAIAEAGPVIVEANRVWTPYPSPDLDRMMRRLLGP